MAARLSVRHGATQDFRLGDLSKDSTLRFDGAKLFATRYLIRDGSVTGVLAPQCGQHHNFYTGLTRRF